MALTLHLQDILEIQCFTSKFVRNLTELNIIFEDFFVKKTISKLYFSMQITYQKELHFKLSIACHIESFLQKK